MAVKWMKCQFYDGEVVNDGHPWSACTDKQNNAINDLIASKPPGAVGALVGDKFTMTTGCYGALKVYKVEYVRLYPDCSIMKIGLRPKDDRWRMMIRPGNFLDFFVILNPDLNQLLLRSVDKGGNLFDHAFSIDTVKNMYWEQLAANLAELEQGADALTIWRDNKPVHPKQKIKNILPKPAKATAAKAKSIPKKTKTTVMKKPAGSS